VKENFLKLRKPRAAVETKEMHFKSWTDGQHEKTLRIKRLEEAESNLPQPRADTFIVIMHNPTQPFCVFQNLQKKIHKLIL